MSPFPFYDDMLEKLVLGGDCVHSDSCSGFVSRDAVSVYPSSSLILHFSLVVLP